MSSGQSLRNGSSVEPGLPNTFLMPNARSREKVASLTVVGVVGLRDTGAPHEFKSTKCNSSSPAMTTNIPPPRSGSPRRRALHGRLALGIRGPQLHAAADIVGVDGELGAFEQRLQAAIGKLLRRLAAVKFGGEFDDQCRLQRTVEDQARIALDLGDVIAIVMDAVAVEGQRGVAKQQHGIADMGLAVFSDGRRWRRFRDRRGAAAVAIDQVLALTDRDAARRRDDLFDGDEATPAGRAGLD